MCLCIGKLFRFKYRVQGKKSQAMEWNLNEFDNTIFLIQEQAVLFERNTQHILIKTEDILNSSTRIGKNESVLGWSLKTYFN